MRHFRGVLPAPPGSCRDSEGRRSRRITQDEASVADRYSSPTAACRVRRRIHLPGWKVHPVPVPQDPTLPLRPCHAHCHQGGSAHAPCQNALCERRSRRRRLPGTRRPRLGERGDPRQLHQLRFPGRDQHPDRRHLRHDGRGRPRPRQRLLGTPVRLQQRSGRIHRTAALAYRQRHVPVLAVGRDRGEAGLHRHLLPDVRRDRLRLHLPLQPGVHRGTPLHLPSLPRHSGRLVPGHHHRHHGRHVLRPGEPPGRRRRADQRRWNGRLGRVLRLEQRRGDLPGRAVLQGPLRPAHRHEHRRRHGHGGRRAGRRRAAPAARTRR